MTVDRAARTYVAGNRGLVGSAIWRHLTAAGFTVE
jgi:GDP-L-fucose synthase